MLYPTSDDEMVSEPPHVIVRFWCESGDLQRGFTDPTYWTDMAVYTYSCCRTPTVVIVRG